MTRLRALCAALVVALVILVLPRPASAHARAGGASKTMSKWQVRHHKRQHQRLEVVRAARRLLGVPYRWGGTGRGGVDCSGLTRYAYAKVQKHLPHLAAAQMRMGRWVGRKLRPGDLLFYYDGGHVALYLGNGYMIHASSAYGRVVKVPVRRGWDEVRRFIG